MGGVDICIYLVLSFKPTDLQIDIKLTQKITKHGGLVKKQKTKHKNQKNSKKLIISIVVVSLILITIAIYINTKPNPVQHKKQYSEADVDAFYARILNPLIQSACTKQLPFSGLNDRIAEQTAQIFERYQRGIDLHYIKSLSPRMSSENTGMSTELKDGVPCVYVYVPSFMHLYETYGSSDISVRQNQHRAEIIIAFMHELDHLCLGVFPKPGAPAEEYLDAEKRAWALTYDKTVRVFIENKADLLETKPARFQIWLHANGDPESVIWDTEIRNWYMPLYKGYKPKLVK